MSSRSRNKYKLILVPYPTGGFSLQLRQVETVGGVSDKEWDDLLLRRITNLWNEHMAGKQMGQEEAAAVFGDIVETQYGHVITGTVVEAASQ